MSSQYVRQQVVSFLNANWIETPIKEVANVAAAAPSDTLDPFVALRWITHSVSRAAISTNPICWRETGTFEAVIFVASNTGTDEALTLAEDMRDLLLQNMNLAPYIFLERVSAPEETYPSEDENFAGNWYALSVMAEYRYDFFQEAA